MDVQGRRELTSRDTCTLANNSNHKPLRPGDSKPRVHSLRARLQGMIQRPQYSHEFERHPHRWKRRIRWLTLVGRIHDIIHLEPRGRRETSLRPPYASD